MARGLTWFAFVGWCSVAGCAALPHGAQCWSRDGRALQSPAVDATTQQSDLDALAAAESKWRAEPRDRDAVVWYARRLGYVGRFREAVAVLGEALDFTPDDPFLLRHRGHRWITLREFGRAAQDLERAARACRTTPDVIEPDGKPVPGRPPHSTLHYNVHYHLGLAYFLDGDFELAERAWLDCLAVVANDESRVAVSHWLWCARMRRGNVAGAAAVVAPITAAMDVQENVAYLNLCLLYGGKKSREAIAPRAGSSGASLAFGLGHYDLCTGARDGGLAALRGVAANPGWTAFGVIAAEVEVQRWR
jgi:Flp pilus assembly protein TadD